MVDFVFIAELPHMAELQGVKHFKIDKNLLERKFELQDLLAKIAGNLHL